MKDDKRPDWYNAAVEVAAAAGFETATERNRDFAERIIHAFVREASQRGYNMRAREHPHQRGQHFCAVRLTGGKRPVCVYLADGTKVRIVRGGDDPVVDGVWLEVVPQAMLHPAAEIKSR